MTVGGRQFGWGIHLAGVEVVKYTVGSHLRKNGRKDANVDTTVVSYSRKFRWCKFFV